MTITMQIYILHCILISNLVFIYYSFNMPEPTRDDM
uniref:Uncharacterized protein n=1 Tax=Anguilla anguilla TaxID=7936 RepID=A0A0E9TRR9_ANGAN